VIRFFGRQKTSHFRLRKPYILQGKRGQLDNGFTVVDTDTSGPACFTSAGNIAMSTSSQFSDLAQLSVAERILVVEQIWDSIAAEQSSLPVTPAQQKELDRRLESYRRSPREGASLEEVKARIQVKK